MSNLDKVDIKGLTKEAESGNGCGIKDALSTLFWEERMAALKMIAAENQMNRAKDPKVVELKFHPSLGRLPGMDLHHSSSTFGPGPAIYVEQLYTSSGTFNATCKRV